MQTGQREVGYWFGRQYWGKGVATRALAAFLDHVAVRPLYAHVVKLQSRLYPCAGKMWVHALWRGRRGSDPQARCVNM